jgi:hypothetical protein
MYKDINHEELIKGVKFWKNPLNKFAVLMVHYSADPQKDTDRQGKEWVENERAGMPLIKWNKEYEIDFSTKSGKLVYGKEFCDYDENIHCINSFEFQEPIEYLISLDFGQRNPTAALIGIWTLKGKLYIVDEYYNPAIPSVSSKEMMEKFYPYFKVDYDVMRTKPISERRRIIDNIFQIKVIDPSTAAKNRVKVRFGEEIEYSVIEDFYDNGWEFEPGNNDVNSGITRIREYMQINPNNGEPSLYIFKDKCPNLVQELRNYRYKEYTEEQAKTRNVSEDVVKKNDHCVDSLRYMIMTRPFNPIVKPQELTRVQKDIQKIIKPRIVSPWDDDS